MFKYLKKYNIRNYNFILVGLVIVLTVFGIIVIDSAGMSAGYEKKQLFGMVIGIIGMVVMSLIDYRFLSRFYWVIYAFNILLLTAVLFLGRTAKGARRWIYIGGEESAISLQPSELCKIFLIVFLAKFLTRFIKELNTIKFLLLTAVLVAIPLGLVLLEPDLSTTLLLCMLIAGMLYCAGLSYKIILIAVSVLVPVAVAFIIYIQNPASVESGIIKEYQRDRIMAFIDPANYADDRYQQDNSVLAIGSGQLYGKGLNNDDPTSVKNAGYLPEPQTDFISAIIGEELGFVGISFTLLLLFLIILQCIILGIKAPDLVGRLICMGMACLLTFQTFINIGVATEILPNTGVTLPFVSYGLSSLVALYGGMGIVLNVGLNQRRNN